jgi:8-oxo-dGTP pyrophosphatase MutT (NUDIX family)
VELTLPLRRLGYRVAYAGLRGYWFLARPETNGVKCVLTDGEKVLLVRHTYGPRVWDLPGGSVKAGESPADTATREMREELGLDVDAWQQLGELMIGIDHRRDHVHCFHAELYSPPELKLDLGELSAAQWFDRRMLPKLGRYTEQILALAGD